MVAAAMYATTVVEIRAEAQACRDGLVCPMESLQKIALIVITAIDKLAQAEPDCALPGTSSCVTCRNKVSTAIIDELLGRL